MGSLYKNVTFGVNATNTEAISLNSYSLVGFTTGSTCTNNALTFLVSNDDATYYPLYDNTSTEVSITGSQIPRAYSLDAVTFWPWQFVKIRQGTSASALAQLTWPAVITLSLQQI